MKYLKYILMILSFFFNPDKQKKDQLTKEWNELKSLERAYREALANGDPQRASEIDKEMRELRKKFQFINKK